MKFLYIFSLLTLLIFSQATPAKSSILSLVEEPSGIRLEAKSIHLIDLLIEIQTQSGIRFDIPEHMDETPVSFHLKEKDWKSLVSAVMRDFNKIEVWSKDPGKSYVKIMGVGNYVPTFTNTPHKISKKKPAVTAPTRTAKTQKNKARPSVRLDPVQKEPFQQTTAQQAQALKKEPIDENDARERVTALRKKLKEEREAREYVDPNHPMAKLPAEVLLEPGIVNYLLSRNVDIPEGIKNKYGIGLNTPPKSLPIAPHIYNDPKLKEYFAAIGLPMPPQFQGQ
jgi:hypothetical protein